MEGKVGKCGRKRAGVYRQGWSFSFGFKYEHKMCGPYILALEEPKRYLNIIWLP